MSTDVHAKYYAYALTRRSASDSIDKFGPSLLNATVDLNPHQIEAALFAFRSSLSRGAVLADEVGLGKTIEAGLIISKLWAERSRKRRALYDAQDEIERKKESLISDVEAKLQQRTETEELFTIRWEVR